MNLYPVFDLFLTVITIIPFLFIVLAIYAIANLYTGELHKEKVSIGKIISYISDKSKYMLFLLIVVIISIGFNYHLHTEAKEGYNQRYRNYISSEFNKAAENVVVRTANVVKRINDNPGVENPRILVLRQELVSELNPTIRDMQRLEQMAIDLNQYYINTNKDYQSLDFSNFSADLSYKWQVITSKLDYNDITSIEYVQGEFKKIKEVFSPLGETISAGRTVTPEMLREIHEKYLSIKREG
ncbi:hypothetical protein HYG86_03645 [Alkalicella caledoniensis]|uniref:Uncharacterized protein n=1 Tax=Alkalicella caledoniensis TaxID=2731377 RepID=A0A7G9W5G3_ALKCA|nr:hypothetical protein [Alkalicella caledoniensis]QNO13925.1 hypothetical protein HYG86_03645 [Alkalicella caledoniensis]